MEILQNSQKAQNNNSQNFQDNNLNIVFKVRGQGDDSLQFTIQADINEKVSSLIDKYRSKSGDLGQKKKFIYNAKALHPSLTCAEAGLSNNAIIQVIDTQDLEGGLYNIN